MQSIVGVFLERMIKNDKLVDKLRDILHTEELDNKAGEYIDNSYEQNKAIKDYLSDAISDLQDDIFNYFRDHYEHHQAYPADMAFNLDEEHETILNMNECFELISEYYDDLKESLENKSPQS